MAIPQSPIPAGGIQKLPPITVDGHALFEFSMKIGRALKRLEIRYKAKQVVGIPALRKQWKPSPNKPR